MVQVVQVVHEEIRPHSLPVDAATLAADVVSASSFTLDHLDQARKTGGFSGPGWDGPPGPPWTDDRAWLSRWIGAGPTLTERLPVLEAWLTVAPPPPLPRRLAAVELARIARNHGIMVEVGS
jgi:hypothetical protein